jgi:hypothetical protein
MYSRKIGFFAKEVSTPEACDTAGTTQSRKVVGRVNSLSTETA